MSIPSEPGFFSLRFVGGVQLLFDAAHCFVGSSGNLGLAHRSVDRVFEPVLPGSDVDGGTA
jgi:hypothetical protein